MRIDTTADPIRCDPRPRAAATGDEDENEECVAASLGCVWDKKKEAEPIGHQSM